MDLLYILGYYSTACVYFSFRWGPFVHSLGIVQWNFTRRDHLGNPGRVSGSGPGGPKLKRFELKPKTLNTQHQNPSHQSLRGFFFFFASVLH